MSSLADVERLVDPGEPTRRSKVVKVSVYLSRRSWKRYCEVMPERSFSWFVRSAIDRFLDEIEELPNDAIARICRLLVDDLDHMRTGPILKRKIRT